MTAKASEFLNTTGSAGLSDIVKRQTLMQEQSIKLLDYDNYDIMLAELDRYVKNQRKKQTPPIDLFLKESKLSSLIKRRPADENILRLMDMRIRVLLYQMKNQLLQNMDELKHYLEVF